MLYHAGGAESNEDSPLACRPTKPAGAAAWTANSTPPWHRFSVGLACKPCLCSTSSTGSWHNLHPPALGAVSLWRDVWEGSGNDYGDGNRSSKDTHPSSAAGGRLRERLAMINRPGHITISEHRRNSQGDPLPCPPGSLSPRTTTGSYQQRRLWERVTSGHSVLPWSLEPSRQFTTLSLVHTPSSSAQFLPLN